MLFRERYEHDLWLIRGSQAWVAAGVAGLFLLALPFLFKGYVVYNFTLFFVYALVALSLSVLVGLTGQVSLGHAGFLAAGAYAQAVLVSQGVPFLLALPLTIALVALLGVVIGVPALRLEGPYLAIATLGFGLAIQQILNNWRLVGASTGMLVERPVLFGVDLYGDTPYYYLVLAVAGVTTWALFNLERSHVGRAFRATRDADLAAQMSGIGLARYKTLAFVISAGVAGLAGALYGPLIGYITPESFNLLLSIKFLLMTIVGGLGFLPGALLGAGFITGLDVWLSTFRSWSQLVFGVVVIAIMMLEPAGLYGRWLKIKRFWKSWPL
ncbi:MAG: branched-chain amino acid ABC transporter permease [Deinococcales bacterium]|nr:branched-chain amino acid ABC transporter permease [Deinococcales bacterium]